MQSVEDAADAHYVGLANFIAYAQARRALLDSLWNSLWVSSASSRW